MQATSISFWLYACLVSSPSLALICSNTSCMLTTLIDNSPNNVYDWRASDYVTSLSSSDSLCSVEDVDALQSRLELVCK